MTVEDVWRQRQYQRQYPSKAGISVIIKIWRIMNMALSNAKINVASMKCGCNGGIMLKYRVQMYESGSMVKAK